MGQGHAPPPPLHPPANPPHNYPPPQVLTDSRGGGGVASGPLVVAPPGMSAFSPRTKAKNVLFPEPLKCDNSGKWGESGGNGNSLGFLMEQWEPQNCTFVGGSHGRGGQFPFSPAWPQGKMGGNGGKWHCEFFRSVHSIFYPPPPPRAPLVSPYSPFPPISPHLPPFPPIFPHFLPISCPFPPISPHPPPPPLFFRVLYRELKVPHGPGILGVAGRRQFSAMPPADSPPPQVPSPIWLLVPYVGVSAALRARHSHSTGC